jgi:hypothetical protein
MYIVGVRVPWTQDRRGDLVLGGAAGGAAAATRERDERDGNRREGANSPNYAVISAWQSPARLRRVTLHPGPARWAAYRGEGRGHLAIGVWGDVAEAQYHGCVMRVFRTPVVASVAFCVAQQ